MMRSTPDGLYAFGIEQHVGGRQEAVPGRGPASGVSRRGDGHDRL